MKSLIKIYIEIANQNLSFIIGSLGTSSAIKVANGIIKEYTIRPSSVRYDIQKDVSALNANIFKDANVIISAIDGSTPDGSSVVLSNTVNSVMFDLDGDIEILNGNTPGFLTKNNDLYILNSGARYESIARLGVKISDNTYKIFTITKDFSKFIYTYNSSVETYSIVYHANGGEGEDYVVSKVACGENILATLAETKFIPKENKQFAGWAKSENGKVINEIIINIDGNKDLYAIWKDIEIDPEPTAEPEPSTEPEPTTEPEPSTEPEPTAEPEPTTEPEPSTEPEPTTEPVQTTELETENLGISTGAIIGIIFGCIAIVVGFSIYYFVVRKRKRIKQTDMDIGLNLK